MKNAPVLHRGEYGAFLALNAALRPLGHRGARAIGGQLGDLAWFLMRSRRRVALGNLALALPELGERQRRHVARASFRHLGRMICDTVSALRFDAVGLCRQMTLEGWEHFEEARSRGRGVLVMSAHLGSWEIAAYPVGLYAEPMHVIGRPLDNPLLDRRLTEIRTRFGNETIPKRGAARGALRVLSRRGVVGILIDQRVQPAEGERVPFFGHPAVTSPLLGRLAVRTGAPIVPLFGRLEPGGRYRVVFHPAIEPTEKNEVDATTITRSCLEVVERQIRAAPSTWLWLHRRWKHSVPDGA